MKMNKIKGDLIKLAIEGQFDLIVHGCNCFCTMGAGIAKTIKQKFPEGYQADLETEKGDKSKLGTISWAETVTENGKLIIVNGYTQYNWKGRGRKADYNAIRKVFKKVKKSFSGLRIGYPAIGAGLAGGDWEIISEIIGEELEGEDHTFVEYRK
jgi:O-acetyl-ADP-ribose deacetylase (regulator of RNase III)